MPISEAEFLMSAFVAFGTFALAIATFMTILRDEKEKKLSFRDRRLDEIRFILIQEITWFKTVVVLFGELTSTCNKIRSFEHNADQNADPLVPLEGLNERLKKILDRQKPIIDNLFESAPNLFALLHSTTIENHEFNRLTKIVSDGIIRFTQLEAMSEEAHKLAATMIDSLQQLIDLCIILRR